MACRLDGAKPLYWNNWNGFLRNQIQWIRNQNQYIFFQEIAFENVVWKMAAILSQPQCVNDNREEFCIGIYIYIYMLE